MGKLSDRCKYGYRGLGKVLSDEQTFLMVRKFGELNVRAMLALQDEIVQLEEELNDREEYNREIVDEDYNNGSMRNDPDSERMQLIKKAIVPALTTYNNFVNSYTKLARHPIADPRERTEVHKWFMAHPTAIDDPERQYIHRHDDLISVLPLEKSWFRKMLEWTFVCKLPIFRRKLAGDPSEKAEVALSHHKRLERFSTTIIALFGLGMLIGPLWILDAVKEAEKQLAVITAFIVLFFVVVAIATNAKVFESLAAAAAYSAVLMVFLQLGNPNSSIKVAPNT